MIIRRDGHLERKKNLMHTDSIKIITGIRREGKSFLGYNMMKKKHENEDAGKQ